MSSQTAFSFEDAYQPEPLVVTSNIDDDDVLTIVIAGELDIATVGLLEWAQRSVQDSYRTIRYELADLGFMDSAGLRALLAPASSHPPVRQISIVHPTPIVRRVLELRGLQGIITE